MLADSKASAPLEAGGDVLLTGVGDDRLGYAKLIRLQPLWQNGEA